VGIAVARKGRLVKKMTWNTMPLKDIEKWLKNRKK
jgi:hypothetical protein